MDEWTEKASQQKLNLIRETRWWSKVQALCKLFGCSNKPNGSIYIDLIIILQLFIANDWLRTEARVKAKYLIKDLIESMKQ